MYGFRALLREGSCSNSGIIGGSAPSVLPPALFSCLSCPALPSPARCCIFVGARCRLYVACVLVRLYCPKHQQQNVMHLLLNWELLDYSIVLSFTFRAPSGPGFSSSIFALPLLWCSLSVFPGAVFFVCRCRPGPSLPLEFFAVFRFPLTRYSTNFALARLSRPLFSSLLPPPFPCSLPLPSLPLRACLLASNQPCAAQVRSIRCGESRRRHARSGAAMIAS